MTLIFTRHLKRVADKCPVIDCLGLGPTVVASAPSRVVLASLLIVFWLFDPSARTAVAQIDVTVHSTDGGRVTGRLEQLTATQVFVRTGENVESITVTDVLRVAVTPERAGDVIAANSHATPDPSATPWLVTSTGDWLRVRPLMIDDESVVARWSHFPNQPPLTVPLEVCRGVVLELSGDPYRQGIEFVSLFDAGQTTDRIVLQNGDRIAGEFTGLDDGRLQLETPLGMTTADFAKVKSIAFNPELISKPEPPAAHTRVSLRDGSLLRLKSVLSNGAVLLGETLADAPISLPLENVIEVCFFDANRVPLSLLAIAETQLTPFLSVRRMPQPDRNVLGSMLRVRGIPAASGIGTSSGSTMTFALDAGFKALLGRVALDDAAGEAGAVSFDILGDGSSLWSSGVVTVASGSIDLPRLDVSQISRLVLKVNFADRGSVRDIANWCDMLLLK